MSQAQVSTILFNEWICVSAEEEKTLSRIGKGVYSAFLKKKLVDPTAIDYCSQISELFNEARVIREELQDEMERDALKGLSLEETKKLDSDFEPGPVQKIVRSAKLFTSRIVGRVNISQRLGSHRNKIK